MTQSQSPVSIKQPNKTTSKLVLIGGFLLRFMKWGLIFLLLLLCISVFVFYQYGDQLLQQQNIQYHLKQKIAYAFKTSEQQVQWQKIQLTWQGPSPHIFLQNFSVKNQQNEPLIQLQKANIDLGRLDLGIEKATIDGLNLHIYNRLLGLEIAGFISDNSPTPAWFKWINKNQLNDAKIHLHLKPLRIIQERNHTIIDKNINIELGFNSLLDFSNEKNPLQLNVKNINWLENPDFIDLNNQKIKILAQPNFQNNRSLEKNITLSINELRVGKSIINQEFHLSQHQNHQAVQLDLQLSNFLHQKSFKITGNFEAEKSYANLKLQKLTGSNQYGTFDVKEGNCSMQHCSIKGLAIAPFNGLLKNISDDLLKNIIPFSLQITRYLPNPQLTKLKDLGLFETITSIQKEQPKINHFLTQWKSVKNVSGNVDELQWHQDGVIGITNKTKKQGIKLKISQLGGTFEEKVLPKTDIFITSKIDTITTDTNTRNKQHIISDVMIHNNIIDFPNINVITDIENDTKNSNTNTNTNIQQSPTIVAHTKKGSVNLTQLQKALPELSKKLNIHGILKNIQADFTYKTQQPHWHIKGQGDNIIVKLSDKIPLLTGNPTLEIHDKNVTLTATPLILKNQAFGTIANLSSVTLNLKPQLLAISLAPTRLQWNKQEEFTAFYNSIKPYIPSTSSTSEKPTFDLSSLKLLGRYDMSGTFEKMGTAKPTYQASIKVKDGSLNILPYPEISNLTGLIELNHQPKNQQFNQIKVDQLTAFVGGQPVKIHGIPNDSDDLGHSNHLMTIQGSANIDELVQKYPHLSQLKPLNLITQGVIDFEATVNPQKIDVYSNLKNAQIQLPIPLKKLEKGVEAPIYMSYKPKTNVFYMEWKDRLFGLLNLKTQNQSRMLKDGFLYLGSDSQQVATPVISKNSGLSVFGQLKQLNLDDWKGFLTELNNIAVLKDEKNNQTEQEDINTKQTAQEMQHKEMVFKSWLPKKMNISVDDLQFDERKLHHVQLNVLDKNTTQLENVEQKGTLWQMNISSDEIKGEATWLQNTRLSNRADKVKAYFSEMTIPQKDLSLLKTLLGYENPVNQQNITENKNKPKESIQIPEIDLTIKQLKYHQQNLGTAILKTEIDPLSPEYVLLDELSIDGPLLQTKISGYFPNQLKNNQKKNNLMTTDTSLKQKENVGFEWKLKAPKMELLSELIPNEITQKQPQLKSLFSSGNINAKGSIGWNGQLFIAPKDILKSIQGNIHVDVQNIRVIPLDLGWGKGLSLFNPKTWARFMVLNFSTLLDKGLLIDDAKLSAKINPQKIELVDQNYVDNHLAKIHATGVLNFDSSLLFAESPNLNTTGLSEKTQQQSVIKPAITLNIEPKIATGIGATVLSIVSTPLVGLGLIGGDYIANFPLQEWLSFNYQLQ